MTSSETPPLPCCAVEAAIAEGDDPSHEGAGYFLSLKLHDGTLFIGAVKAHGPGWVSLVLQGEREQIRYINTHWVVFAALQFS